MIFFWNVDWLAALFEIMRSLSTVFDGKLIIRFIVASIEVSEFAPVTAKITTLADKELNLEDISSRIMEGTKALKSNNGLNRASAASSGYK